MKTVEIPYRDVTYLDALILEDVNGRQLPKVQPFEAYRDIPQQDIMAWCNARGVYVLPTTELIQWLAYMIGGRSAVEICAGYGSIGRALGIPRTDSYMQLKPKIAAWMMANGQMPIAPPPDVERLDACISVNKYKAQVVVAAFATQLYATEDDGPVKVGSSIYGVDELYILPRIETYIHIGNLGPHGDKRIRQLEHKEFFPPWLITRAVNQADNRIMTWGYWNG